MYVCTTIITYTWFWQWHFEFNLAISDVRSTWVINYFNPIFCPKCRWLIWCVVPQTYYFFDSSYINHRWPIILCLSSEDIYLSFRFFLSKHVFYLLWTASELFYGELFETFLSTSVANCLTWSKSSWLYIFMAYVFTYIFTNIVSHTLSKRQTSIAFYKYYISRSNWRASQFCILHFI